MIKMHSKILPNSLTIVAELIKLDHHQPVFVEDEFFSSLVVFGRQKDSNHSPNVLG
jgi:hypothetical protein